MSLLEGRTYSTRDVLFEMVQPGVQLVDDNFYTPLSDTPAGFDMSVTHACNLDCFYCWELEPTDKQQRGKSQTNSLPQADPEQPKIRDWHERRLEVIGKLPESGIRNITYTGGETLLYNRLGELIEASNEGKMGSVISTNGTLLSELCDIAPILRKKGGRYAVGFDGATPETHNKHRKGPENIDQFELAMRAILMHQRRDLPVTIRTVVTTDNKDEVEDIPHMLKKRGLKLGNGGVKHKLYELAPEGPRLNTMNWEQRHVPAEDVLRIAGRIAQRYNEPEGAAYMNYLLVRPQLFQQTTHRYLHGAPNGRAYTIAMNDAGMPYDYELGNIYVDYDNVMRRYKNYAHNTPAYMLMDRRTNRQVNSFDIGLELLRRKPKSTLTRWLASEGQENSLFESRRLMPLSSR